MIGILIFIPFKEDTVCDKCEVFSMSLNPAPHQCKLFFSHKRCESGILVFLPLFFLAVEGKEGKDKDFHEIH